MNSLFSIALSVFPAVVYLVVLAVIANDVLDLLLFRKVNGKYPNGQEYMTILEADVANKALVAVALASGIAYFSVTGDKVGAAKAIFIAGCAANLALEENGIKSKIAQFLSKGPAATPTIVTAK